MKFLERGALSHRRHPIVRLPAKDRLDIGANMKIVTSAQMREIEARSQQAGVSAAVLMENAGLAVAGRIRHYLGRVVGVRMAFLIGPGNNGGDGLVTARHLHAWGARVTVFLCSNRPADDPNLAVVLASDAEVQDATTEAGLDRLREVLGRATMAVDALLGTGRSRSIEGVLKSALEELILARDRRSALCVVALDVPSGLDADTGSVDPVCPIADITVTLGNPKVGIYRFPGAEHVGTVHVEDIGVPAGLDGDVGLELITGAWSRAVLPGRPLSSHKGTFGKALVVAGSRSYVGAAYLAATAAMRAGAGLVTLAIPESILPAVAAKAAEPTYIPLPESSAGVLAPHAAESVLEQLPSYDSLLVGCGLGQAPSTTRMLEALLYSGVRLPPTVVDADGLNFLSRSREPGWWERFSFSAIVTPHPGEMRRLSAEADPAGDRVEQAAAAAKKWNKVVVLKGAYTVVASPDAEAMLSPSANPGLASAGTGDVLAGVIVGLLAQGLGLEDAASLGVHLHALAGERVREDLGEAGALAGDLLPALPRAIKDLRAGTTA